MMSNVNDYDLNPNLEYNTSVDNYSSTIKIVQFHTKPKHSTETTNLLVKLITYLHILSKMLVWLVYSSTYSTYAVGLAKLKNSVFDLLLKTKITSCKPVSYPGMISTV